MMSGASGPTHRHVGDAVELSSMARRHRRRRSCRRERFTQAHGGRWRAGVHLRDQVGGAMKSSTGRHAFLATCALAGAAATRALLPRSDKPSTTPRRRPPVRAAHHGCEVRIRAREPVRQDPRTRGSGVRRSGRCHSGHLPHGPELRPAPSQPDPLNVHRLFEQLRKGSVFGGAQSGIFVAVLSAVETALWDLAGKALNVPVYQLLGGKFRDRIRVYWIRRIRRSCLRRSNLHRRGQRPPRTATPL